MVCSLYWQKSLISKPYFKVCKLQIKCVLANSFLGEVISNSKPSNLFGTNVHQTIESCWYWLMKIFTWTNTTLEISSCGTLSGFLSFIILRSVLPSFVAWSVKSPRYYPVLILNVFYSELCWRISELRILNLIRENKFREI